MTRYFPVDADGETNLCISALVRYAEQYGHREVWWLVHTAWNGSHWVVAEPTDDYVLAFAERDGAEE